MILKCYRTYASLVVLIALVFFICLSQSQNDECNVNANSNANGNFYLELTGGQNAPLGRYPYMMSIQALVNGEYKHHCGGTLLSPSLILSAAHCIYLRLNQGTIDLRSAQDLQGDLKPTPTLYATRSPFCRKQVGEGGRVKITKFYLSQDYNGGPRGGGDIVILETEVPFNYSGPFINYDASTINFQSTGLFTALGYGATDVLDLESQGQGRNVPLQLGFLAYMNDEQCQDILYEFNSLYEMIPGMNLCFGEKGVDTCSGDSGGPVLLANDNYGLTASGDPYKDVQVGITSWGPVLDCTTSDRSIPGVYTSIQHYASWIKFIVDQNSAGQVPPATASAPEPAQGCEDRQPPDGITCERQKGFGKCQEEWMLSGGYCKKTCELCVAEVGVARSMLQCFGEPQANYRGEIILLGTKNLQDTVEDCCLSCDADQFCNVWVYCPREAGCRNLDEVLDYKRCDLKFQQVVTDGGIPEVYYRGNETDFTSGYIIGKSGFTG